MIYIQKGVENTLVLNINNNSRDSFTGYSLTFTHIMSKEEKTYNIDTSDNSQYGSNNRYCEIVLPLNEDDLNYEGQYQLKIFGTPDDVLVFTSMVYLEGLVESEPFTQYISNNEVNENFIYIQD